LHSIVKTLYICTVNFENIQSQMRKGVLEYCILAVIAREEIYASDILSKLKEARLIVVEGTLYPLLTRLKNAGLLNYRWVESLQGPPRKYYSITENGKLFLAELDKTWQDLNESVKIATGNDKMQVNNIPQL
jgi:PadR family transcriptional regulator, regulatory protein PadR